MFRRRLALSSVEKQCRQWRWASTRTTLTRRPSSEPTARRDRSPSIKFSPRHPHRQMQPHGRPQRTTTSSTRPRSSFTCINRNIIIIIITLNRQLQLQLQRQRQQHKRRDRDSSLTNHIYNIHLYITSFIYSIFSYKIVATEHTHTHTSTIIYMALNSKRLPCRRSSPRDDWNVTRSVSLFVSFRFVSFRVLAFNFYPSI